MNRHIAGLTLAFLTLSTNSYASLIEIKFGGAVSGIILDEDTYYPSSGSYVSNDFLSGSQYESTIIIDTSTRSDTWYDQGDAINERHVSTYTGSWVLTFDSAYTISGQASFYAGDYTTDVRSDYVGVSSFGLENDIASPEDHLIYSHDYITLDEYGGDASVIIENGLSLDTLSSFGISSLEFQVRDYGYVLLPCPNCLDGEDEYYGAYQTVYSSSPFQVDYYEITAVPIPGALWLFSSSLISLVLYRKNS